MSVFSMGTAATDKLFLEFILPGLNIEIKENSTLYGRFKTDTTNVSGKYAVFKCLTKAPASARPSSSSTLPTAKQGTYDEFLIYMKRGMYAQLQFDGLALACSKGKGAVMDVLKAEIQGITTYMANKLNRQFWGDGSGRLAQLSAANVNDTTITIDGPFFGSSADGRTDPSNYLDEGQAVDIYSTLGVLEAEDVTISSISKGGAGTDTLTMAENVTASNDAWIFDHDTYAASQAAGTGVPMGLNGIIEVSDPYTGITETSFQNIDRDTNVWARAHEVNMGGVVLTNAKILQTIMDCEKWGRVKVIITNEIIWRAYYAILEADKTLPNEKAFWGGLEGLAFYGGRAGKIPILYDPDCPDYNMYFIDDSVLKVFAPTQNGMTWIPGDSGILTRVQGKDEWVASLVWYYNFGTNKPQALGKLYGIKHAAA